MAEQPKPEVPGGSQTLERALRLLALFAENPAGLTVSEIADKLDTHRAGVYRLVRPLQAWELVERRPDGSYVLGVGLITLAGHVRSRLKEIAGIELQRLANSLFATCALTIRSGEEGVVVLVNEPLNSRVHIAYRPGVRHPLTQAASGLAILAGDAPREGERREVKEARRVGYAVTHDELLVGATGLGAPIYGADGASEASISVVWLGKTVDIDEAAVALMRAAATITASLAQEPRNPLGSEADSGFAAAVRPRTRVG
jgi:DNA-binding IclR family transcriptional regulator